MSEFFVPITAFGSLGGSQHTTHEELDGGRTAITTEALLAYNNLRAFLGLGEATLETVGRWAFSKGLTNNTTAWGDDESGVGLWYAMQGAKVGWIADSAFDPQLLADLQRTARLGEPDEVLELALRVDREGYIEYLQATDGVDAFINTLKMEPHYGGWMHSRAHGWLGIHGGAIAHDLNHLTVLSHDQSQPFMNDTFNWPQWPALEVPHPVVINYFQSMVMLSDPTEPIPQGNGTSPEPTPQPAPEPTNDQEKTPIDSALDVHIGGDLWWNGFTAEITLSNRSDTPINDWSWSFISPHTISGEPWGASVATSELGDGSFEHTLSGSDWGQHINPGQSITIGFNGTQQIAIGNSGSLSAALLLRNSEPAQPQPDSNPSPQPTPEPTPQPAPEPTDDQEKTPIDSALDVHIGGDLWWNGFTAEITLSNRSDTPINDWSWSFISPHTISGEPWGASVATSELGDGSFEHTLSGSDWGQHINPGQSITIGFNGTQQIAIGNSGSLSAALLLRNSEPAQPQPDSNPSPQPTTEPTPQPAPEPTDEPTPGSLMGYDLALGLSFLFYEANRSGDLDEANNRIPWRGDSGLNDGRDGIYFGDANPSNLQAGLSLDLTGGYHDAGDHVKFGLPLASTLSTLAWGGISFADGYQATDQMDALLETVRWGTDYLLKAQGRDATGATTYFIAQVGDGDADHAQWSAPEDQTIQRPAMAVTPEKPGSDVAAASAAALASASILFRQSGEQNYADTLLDASVSLYAFADCYQGKYSDSIGAVQSFYNSWNGYHDELAYGAAWLARAVEADGGVGDNYRATALDLYQNKIVGLNKGWTHNWDDASYATAVLLAQDAGDAGILADVRSWLDSWVEGTNGVQITDGGLRHISTWGSLRYAANTAMMAGEVADKLIDPDGRYSQLASETIDYILGSNPRQSSYVVGFGDNFPQQPHHRAASGVGWDEFNSDQPNAHVLAGALVGGPSAADDFAYSDSRSDYISNEVAIDYNAGLTGALAFLSQL